MINNANIENSTILANLHYQTITKGFLPKLGTSFLKYLYAFLINNEIVLIYKEENKILGFVSCALNMKGLMKRFFMKNPSIIAIVFRNLIKKPKIIVSLFETFRAPLISRKTIYSETILPSTELLSICVDSSAQKGSIGTQLLYALEQELRNKGIKKYKVIAGESLIGANKFYLKNGFELATQIVIHGNSLSNVYVKTL
jgi:ribosomal protein S18 acetylase RimI-like enzyme